MEARSAEQIERSGKWIRRSESNKGRIDYWGKLGLLVPTRDYRTFKTLVKRPVRGDFVRDVTFYRSSRLEALAKIDWQGSRKKKCKDFRSGQERLVKDGAVHLRIGAAATYLGLTRAGLRARKDFPPDVIEKVAGKETPYYALPRLRAFKKRQDGLNKAVRGQVNLEQAAIITHRSTWTLRDEEWCKDNGITQHKRKGYRKKRGQAVAYWFDKKELIAYRDRPKFPAPPGRMTATEAAEKLAVHPGTVRLLCRLGILNAELGIVRRGWTFREDGWLIEKKSVTSALKVVLKHIGNKVRAGRELRGWALRVYRAQAMPGAESRSRASPAEEQEDVIRELREVLKVLVEDSRARREYERKTLEILERTAPACPDGSCPVGPTPRGVDVLEALYQRQAFSTQTAVALSDLTNPPRASAFKPLGISRSYLAHVALDLKDKLLVGSLRGRVGGYYLTKLGRETVERLRSI